MLTILLNPQSREPLYRQLSQAIQKEIAVGNLRPHEKLPSRRALSMHLQVSMVTVQTAYEQLTAEGYLYAKPRVGYYVDPNAPFLTHVPEQLQRETPLISKEIVPMQTDRIAFSTSGVDLKQFPFSTWAKLSRQVLTTQQETLLQATPPFGLYALRQAISAHLRAFRGIHAAPEQILVGAGTEYLLGLLIQLLGVSRRYAVEDPGYRKGRQILRAGGTSVIAVAMDEDGLRVTDLQESGASVAHVTPSHQFPTGTIMPIHRRLQLLEWADAQEGRYLIEDDYDSEMRLSGKPLPSLYSLDGGQRVIYMNTFARTLAPSLRIGYIVLPLQLAEEMQQKLSFYSCTVPAFEQYTLTRFLQEGYFERHLNRMKKTYSRRQKILLKALRTHEMAQYLRVSGAEAGLQLLLEVQLSLSEQQLVLAAAEAHITIHGLSEYYDVPRSLPHKFPCVVLGYAQLSDAEIVTGIKRLLDAWKKLV